MHTYLCCIATISRLPVIVLALGAFLTWDFAAWLFVAVPWPAPLTVILFWRLLACVPTVRRTHVASYMEQLLEPEERSVLAALVLISWPVRPVRRLLLRVGLKYAPSPVETGIARLAEIDEQTSQWKINRIGSRS